jgi:uncharacterized protein YdaU (DUF1376 family)
LHYYTFNIGDYRRDTSHLTLLEHGLYRQLLDTYYLNEEPLPADEAILMRTHCVRTAEEQQALRNLLQDFFWLSDSGWVHNGCEKVIQQYRTKSQKASESAKVRWERNANALPSQSERYANHKPITNNHKPIKNNNAAEAARAKRLDVIELPEEWAKFCKDTRPDLNPKSIFEQFKDYWVAQGGQKGAKLDWFATWRNWVRNSKSTPMITLQDKPRTKWSDSVDGVRQKGSELGLTWKQGETIGQYQERIEQAMRGAV